jgi:hypothetical protein
MTPDTTIRDATEKESRHQWVVQLSTGAVSLTDDLNRILQSVGKAQQTAHVLLTLSKLSEATGGHVQLRPEYQFVPVLIGDDGEAVPLYHFVEVLDGLVGYDQIKQELPTLSYVQIDGAISFLRKIAQYNPREIDFDALEDEETRSDPAFLNELRRALADKETSRVLHRD